MPLPNLLEPPPGRTGWNEFLFNHYEDHVQIVQAILAQKNVTLTIYNLQQFNPEDPETWLQQHQQMHDDMNGTLGLAGQDLESVDFEKQDQFASWVYIQFQEHLAARATLQI